MTHWSLTLPVLFYSTKKSIRNYNYNEFYKIIGFLILLIYLASQNRGYKYLTVDSKISIDTRHTKPSNKIYDCIFSFSSFITKRLQIMRWTSLAKASVYVLILRCKTLSTWSVEVNRVKHVEIIVKELCHKEVSPYRATNLITVTLKNVKQTY